MSELNIYQRINAVMREVAYVQKDKDVSGGGQTYKAVTHDKVVSVCRAALVKAGVVVMASQASGQMLIMRDGVNVKMHLYEGNYCVSFVNADKPEDRIDVFVQAHAQDNGDKAPGKALTYATKSAILKVLMLETGEDDESRAGQASGFDVDATLLEIDAINDLDTLRTFRKTWADKCARAKDSDTWSAIKSATEVRAKELQS
jgi:hypothetical protein